MFRIAAFLLILLAATARAAAPAPAPASTSDEMLSRLRAAAPGIDPTALSLALNARDCAVRSGAVSASQRLALIDYSLPSTQRRLWVFDLPQARLLYTEFVAHGRGSGENFATAFSNRDGSHQSSLGLFLTADTYIGGNGYSLRMEGLEPGINDKARARAIVMHGARYVDPALASRQGRLGRSYGCPALRPAVAHQMIDTLKQGQLLFAYYPDPDWLARSRFLKCPDRAVLAHR
ncbi:murein L,D-transpeptidase catalytic domain family protein [Lysobacter antibioticus]|uniref:L,D-transpeptidase catalytic domain protein n=1 Tax=Lysobacter antibioticus TaxID=84531 RepID=A0A0S2FBW2_LYSAN|nr:murein L,D-transpeptidase catalytic domain family protein [Lysobacter antibioticus]ALN81019.1 L,D-transpeptidase catalytic domain protein [Lysobacter antibioticus]